MARGYALLENQVRPAAPPRKGANGILAIQIIMAFAWNKSVWRVLFGTFRLQSIASTEDCQSRTLEVSHCRFRCDYERFFSVFSIYSRLMFAKNSAFCILDV